MELLRRVKSWVGPYTQVVSYSPRAPGSTASFHAAGPLRSGQPLLVTVFGGFGRASLTDTVGTSYVLAYRGPGRAVFAAVADPKPGPPITPRLTLVFDEPLKGDVDVLLVVYDVDAHRRESEEQREASPRPGGWRGRPTRCTRSGCACRARRRAGKGPFAAPSTPPRRRSATWQP